MQGLYFFYLIIFYSPCILGLQLTENRCYLQNSLTMEPSLHKNELLVSTDTGLIKTLLRDLKLFYHIQDPKGELVNNLYCAMLPLTTEYGQPIDPPLMPELKVGVNYVVDIQYIVAARSQYCVWGGAVLGLERCKVELKSLAETLGLDQPQFPNKTEKSHYNHFDDSSIQAFPLLFTPATKLTFAHQASDEACVEDVYFGMTQQLTQEFKNNLAKNIFNIFSFIKQLISTPYPREIIYTKDREKVEKFRNFDHAPLIYKLSSSQMINFKFPDIQFKETAPELPDTEAFLSYFALIDIVSEQSRVKSRRGILNSLLGDDPNISKLFHQSEVSARAFQIIKKNSHILVRNQENLQVALNRVSAHEGEVTTALQRQGHRSHQLAVNLMSLSTFTSRRLTRVSFIERLESLLSMAHLQRIAVAEQIEKLSVEKPKTCNFQASVNDPHFLCSQHYPDLTVLDNEITLLNHARRYDLVPYYALECLRFGKQKFQFSGSHVQIIGDRVVTTDKETFPTLCLSSTKHCTANYEESEPAHKVGPCNFLTDGETLALNCFKMTQIVTTDGQELSVGDEPVYIQLSSLPIRLDSGETLALSEVLTVLKADIPMSDINNKSEKTHIKDDLGMSERISPAPTTRTFQEKMDEFVSPTAIGPSKIFFTFSLIFCIAFIITCCCLCCRSPKVGWYCRETAELAAPIGGCQLANLCCGPKPAPPTSPEPSAPILREQQAPLLQRSSSSAPTMSGTRTQDRVYPDLPGFPAGPAETEADRLQRLQAHAEMLRARDQTAGPQTAGLQTERSQDTRSYINQGQPPPGPSHSKVQYQDGIITFGV